MSSLSRRVVLTGIGILNPLGLGKDAFWQGLSEGRSGIRCIQHFDASSLPCRIGGEIADFNPKDFITTRDGRKSLRVMARGIQLAVAAAEVCMAEASIEKDQLDPTRFGVEFGAGLMPTELQEIGSASVISASGKSEVDMLKWGSEGIPAIQPLWMLKYLPNMLACHVSILQNAQGPSNTVTESDVASLLALGEAYRIIERDDADFFLVGGADSKLNSLSFVRHCIFGKLSQRNDAPDKASRPFDRDRDGKIIGEGACVMAMEELEHAKRRGARIYAEVIGFGAAFESKPSSQGLERAMRIALDEARLQPEDIDHVNAHGLSARVSDPREAQAIRNVFGESMPVFAPKSYFGNLAAGGGTTELAASLLALDQGTLPKTLNHDNTDPECPISVVTEPQPVRKPNVLKVNFTNLGQCGAIVCRRWQD